MKKRVLVVGNCSGDHSSIRQTLRQHFDVDVVRGFSADETMGLLGSDGPFDLVLVNRRLSSDGSDGVQLIRRIKSDPRTSDTTVMLLSDYPDYQAAAVEAGALPGFGKSQLHRSETEQRLSAILA